MSYEKHITLELVASLIGRFGPGSKIAQEVPSWIEHLTGTICPERPNRRPGMSWWGKIRQMAADLIPPANDADGITLRTNAELIGNHFGLSPLETQILTFVAVYKLFDTFEHVVDAAIETKEVNFQLIMGMFCKADEAEVRAALRSTGRLHRSGLLQAERRGRHIRIPYDISDRLCSAIMSDIDSVEHLIALLFPSAGKPEAEWQDFEGLGPNAAFLRELLARAISAGTTGVNILLYGPPGTGKSEFAKVLAKGVNAHLREVGVCDETGTELSRRQRLAEISLAGKMLGARRDTILLFDEMDDLIGSGVPFLGVDRPSKVYANRLLEANPIPTIWTVNSVANCDAAFLRRMTYSVHMRRPSGAIRSRIWARLEQRHCAGLSPDVMSGLAERYDLAPALVSDAMRVAVLCQQGEPAVRQVLDAAARLENGGTAPFLADHHETPWMHELAAADIDLAKIETRLANPTADRNVSFCLEGPTGAGKSAWARHLASVMQMSIIEVHASDLLSKWVGESEQRIAQAFAEARANDAILIFNEADSLLADRREAVRLWEVSQVNEMLTWMESHPLPFICTTNLATRLDPAAHRRFTFRIRFNWLGPAQIDAAWVMHFGTQPPHGLRLIEQITAGDFANVARRLRFLQETDQALILDALFAESANLWGGPRTSGLAN